MNFVWLCSIKLIMVLFIDIFVVLFGVLREIIFDYGSVVIDDFILVFKNDLFNVVLIVVRVLMKLVNVMLCKN